MRTARTIGIKKDGSEVVIHPKTVPIDKQLAEFRTLAATGVPKEFVEIEFQASDSRVRSLRNGISAGLKSAEDRANDKVKNREKWLADQKKAVAERAAAKAKEQADRIAAANAAKEAAKKALQGVAAAVKALS